MSATTPGVPPVRQTRQRAAVKAALDGRDEFASAQQLHDELRRQGTSVGLTTVYRSLQALADAGEVDLLVNDDGETLYRRCSAEHHHHLVCRECGRTVEIAGPAVETWADAIATAHGFTDISHTLELFGRCTDCSSG
jgi:Fur family transcriptional regulator, ferric uptake regulator